MANAVDNMAEKANYVVTVVYMDGKIVEYTGDIDFKMTEQNFTIIRKVTGGGSCYIIPFINCREITITQKI